VFNSLFPLLRPPTGIRLSRYFRRNEGTTDYATTSDITMDADVVIEFDINAPPQDDNNAVSFRNVSALNTFGVASGRDLADNAKMRIFSNAVPVVDTATSMDVFDNIFHKVRVEYTLATTSVRVLIDGVEGIAPTTLGYDFSQTDILTVWRDVTTGDEMAGIIANVEIFDAGTLIHKWAINSNSGTETDTVGGAVLTYVNGTSDQWGLFQKQATGEWVGQNIVINGIFATDSEWDKGADWSISGGFANLNTSTAFQSLNQTVSVVGLSYFVGYTVVNYVSGDVSAKLGNTDPATIRSANGTYFETISPASDSLIKIFNTAAVAQYSIDNVSVKEVLNVA
jgi:hypothetical protein